MKKHYVFPSTLSYGSNVRGLAYMLRELADRLEHDISPLAEVVKIKVECALSEYGNNFELRVLADD